jgi:hypothetical protein
VLTGLDHPKLVSMGGCITSALTGWSAVEVVGAVLGLSAAEQDEVCAPGRGARPATATGDGLLAATVDAVGLLGPLWRCTSQHQSRYSERMFGSDHIDRRCSFPECDRILFVKGLCRAHYEQRLRTGSLKPLRSRNPVRQECGFQGCKNLAVAKGLCQSHNKQRKKGQLLRPLRPFYGTKGPCRFDGCPRPRVSGGYCAGHAAQYYSGRPLAPLFRPKLDCDFPGCTKRHFALGYCQGHWRQLRLQRPLTPLREIHRRRMDRGYVLIFEPKHPNARKDGYVAEHTKVMAAELGRPLHRFEEVHHKNGIRHDNRPENLELWARSMQPPGSRVSDLIDASVRVLRLYRPDLLSSSADNYYSAE